MADSPFPHSLAYFARQKARQEHLDMLATRKTWTDAQFLAERDTEYVAKERSYIDPGIKNTQRDMLDDNDTEGYVAFYHTDVG